MKFPQLEKLLLAGCLRLTDASLKAFLLMSGNKLTDHNLHINMLTGQGLDELALRFPQLTRLNLHRSNRLTETGLKEFLLIPGGKLKYLHLGKNKFTGEGLAGMALKFPQLKVLDLRECTSLTEVGLMKFMFMSGKKTKMIR